MTQNEQLKEYFEIGASLTQKEALIQFGCLRLASRIFDLERQGCVFSHELITVPTRTEKTARVARYSMILGDKK